MKQFSSLQEKGIIKNESYDDLVWVMTDETVTCSVDFSVDEIGYEKHLKKVLDCSYKQFQLAMRILITSYFGADVKTLQKMARGGRKLADYISGKTKINELADSSLALVDLLSLLPGESIGRNELLDNLEELQKINGKAFSHGKVQRELAQYQSYFRLDYVMRKVFYQGRWPPSFLAVL